MTTRRIGRKLPARGKPARKARRAPVLIASNPGDRAGLADVARLRSALGLTRKLFSRLSGYSERALAEWEAGRPLSDASRQRMTELDRLQRGLARIMNEEFIGVWLQAPNDAFDGLKPIEVVERGETDRLWRMI